MFGKRASDQPRPPQRPAPPPAASGAPIATRPQRIDPETPEDADGAPPLAAKPAPKPTPAFEQLHAAQGATAAPTEIIREQSDYYHATKTTIFNALLNTIDLSQLAQIELKAAAE